MRIWRSWRQRCARAFDSCVANSITGRGHIHIFVFADLKTRDFKGKWCMQNTNISIQHPPLNYRACYATWRFWMNIKTQLYFDHFFRFFSIVKLTVAVGVFFSFFIQAYVALKIIEPCIVEKLPESLHFVTDTTIRILLVFLTCKWIH